MSQAEDLLNTLSETATEHEHPVIDSDSYFVIDPDTRVIENVAQTTSYIMQFDHDSEIFTFELPRYVEGHDMMLCNVVKVHYNNIDGSNGDENADVADIYDLHISPDDSAKVLCSWTISRQATQLAGILSFLVQYMCTAKDGTATYEWHTDIYSDVEVKAGRNNGESSVIHYTDILEQWRTRLFGAVDEGIQSISDATSTAITQIQNKVTTSTDDQIARVTAAGQEAVDAKDYVQAIVAENEAYTKRESDHRYASSIVNDNSGEHIALEDSSDFVLQQLIGYGKSKQFSTTGAQLFDTSTFEGVGSNISVNISEDGYSITAVGGTSSGYAFSKFSLELDKVLGKTVIVKTDSFTGDSECSVMIYGFKDGANALSYSLKPGMSSVECDITEDLEEVKLYIYTNNTGTVLTEDNTAVIKGLMVSYEDTDWEPYTGGARSPSIAYPQEIVAIGEIRNLFNAYADQSGKYGVATISDNGATISVTGSWYTQIACNLEANRKYTISFSIESYTVNSRGVRIGYADGTFSEIVYTSNFTFTPTQEVTSIYFYSGNDTSGTAVFKNFMVYDASISLSEFHPYKNRYYEVDYDIYAGNLINANAFNQLSTTSFEVSEDEYTITVVGGTSNGWTSASYILPNGLVKAIRGKTLYLACDSFTSAQDINVRIGLNITLEDGSMSYPESLGVTKHAKDIVIPDTTKKIVFAIYSNNTGTSLGTDNTVIVRGLRMGFKEDFKWMPYSHQRLTASKPTPWYGIPVSSGGNYTDQNGIQYIADYRDFERGVDLSHCRKLVFDGNETWQYGDYQGYKYLIHPPSKAGVTGGNLNDFCTHATHALSDAVVAFKGNDFLVSTSIFFSNVQNGIEYTDVSDWKATLAELYANGNPVTVVYQLKTPIETEIPEAEYQAYLSAHTNKLITTIVNDSSVYMDASYTADTKTYFNNSRGASDEQVQASVDAWLTNYFTSAEGVSF